MPRVFRDGPAELVLLERDVTQLAFDGTERRADPPWSGRDAVNPETAFDDAYRQGAWAGVSWRFQRRYRVGFDARSSSGGPAGSATAGTLRTRSTYYRNPPGSGWLESAAFAFEPGERFHLDLNGGLRAEHDPLEQPTNVLVTWVGANLDLTLARAWYGMLSATRQRGGIDGNDQIYGGVSFRF